MAAWPREPACTVLHAHGQLPVRLYCYGPNAERGPRPRSRGTLARRAGACCSGRRGRGPQGDAGARVGDSAAALGRGLRLCITPWNRTRRACRPGPAPGCCPLTLTGAKINTSWVRIQTQTRGSRSPAFAEEGRLSQELHGRKQLCFASPCVVSQPCYDKYLPHGHDAASATDHRGLL